MKVYIKNQQRRRKVSLPRIKKFLTSVLRHLGLEDSELSILFVNDRTMRQLNSTYRGIDTTTDVLSFPQTDTTTFRKSTPGNHSMLGDIVVNLHKAERQAREYHSTFYEELKKLLIHGLLHLIGFDHERDTRSGRKMHKKSKELLSKFSI